MRIIRFLDSTHHIRTGALQPDGTALRIDGDIFADHTITAHSLVVAKLLAPVIPPLILAIGQNYGKHAAEMKSKVADFPVLFMKSPGCIQNPGDPIELPRGLRSDQVDYEVELAIVIGKRAKNVSRENALSHILGYTIANDVTARDWQRTFGGGQWCRGKTFDTFCPLGPAIVTAEDAGNPNDLAISSKLNGQTMQSARTSDLTFNIQTLVSFLSGSTTLLPGTLILTGTPEGIGAARTPPVWLKPGDRMTMTIENLGELSNPVTEEPV